MPPSQISIATSSVQRLLKEIRSYQQEQQGQEKRLADLQALPAEKRDENWEFEVRQQVSNSPEISLFNFLVGKQFGLWH